MKTKKKRSPLVKLLILATIFGLVGAGVQMLPRLAYSLFGDFWLQPEPGGLDAAALAALNQKTGGLKARVVWSSSRSGNHELYMLRLPEGKLFRLTDNENVDYFPRFSPNGEMVAFARSQKKWVSERDYDHWDVWMLDLASGQETLVAKNGNYPVWMNDERVCFMRGTQVVAKNLRTGHEIVLYDGEDPPVGGRIETPMPSPRNRRLLALTGRGGLRGCLVFDVDETDKALDFGDGCEIIFTPDGKRVVWVENGGEGGTRLMTSPADRVEPTVFMDLPGSHSHEYFPRLSPDGRWLVWAASSGGHEHDIADYEIFIWDSAKPWSEAARLTQSKANDRWPDIHLD